MANRRPWRLGHPPEHAPHAYPLTRTGSRNYLVHVLVEARQTAARLGVDIQAAWRKSGVAVEIEEAPILQRLRDGLRELLATPALTSAALDAETRAAVNAAQELLAGLTL